MCELVELPDAIETASKSYFVLNRTVFLWNSILLETFYNKRSSVLLSNCTNALYIPIFQTLRHHHCEIETLYAFQYA